MNRYTKLMNRIKNGESILIDGATGTEIQKRGVPQLENAWNGGGALSHPEILRTVHEDYIRAGAEIIISNTFATHRRALKDAGVEHKFEEFNRRGIEIAIEARERMQTNDVLVAGGISFWSWLKVPVPPPLDELAIDIEDQAIIMTDAGADLLMLEMMVDIDRTVATLKAAQSSGLPVWVGLSCKLNDVGDVILGSGDDRGFSSGGLLTDALDAIQDFNIPFLNIMHTEVEDVDACLDVLENKWSGHIGIYAHSARWVGNNATCIFDNTIDPSDYATFSEAWLKRGAKVIGSCCGTGVEHIQALKSVMKQ